MRKHPRKLAALLLLSACCFTHAAIYAATMASQPWVTNRIGEAEARTDLKITAATNAIPAPVVDLTPATNYTDRALGAFAATGTVSHAHTADSASTADSAMSATWAGRLSSGGSVGMDNFTYEGILAGFSAGTNYTDAVASEFEDGRRTSNYADNSTFAQIASELGNTDTSYTANDLIRESTNAAIAVAERKQDALPYPTNAIPYAAISGAPSGGPEWREELGSVSMGDSVIFVTNGIFVLSFDGAEATDPVMAYTGGWPDGAAMFVRCSAVSGPYQVANNIRLVGYGTWPTNNFQSVWWRSGTNIFVNILLEE